MLLGLDADLLMHEVPIVFREGQLGAIEKAVERAGVYIDPCLENEESTKDCVAASTT